MDILSDEAGEVDIFHPSRIIPAISPEIPQALPCSLVAHEYFTRHGEIYISVSGRNPQLPTLRMRLSTLSSSVNLQPTEAPVVESSSGKMSSGEHMAHNRTYSPKFSHTSA